MTIRARLLAILLPLVIGFIVLLSILYYFRWHKNIVASYQMRLESVVAGCAALLDEWNWLELSRPGSLENSHYLSTFNRISEQLPLTQLYSLPNDGALLEKLPPAVFTEELRQQLFDQKKVIVTPLYILPGTKQVAMAAVAPVLGHDLSIVAFIFCEGDARAIYQQLDKALYLILAQIAVTILFVTGCVYFITNRISKPVEQLKDSALSIAAGEYGKSIAIQGPKEIVELANTLNTMSECLQEHMTRLTENAWLREQMHSEYECSVLLQHQMWRAVIDRLSDAPLLLRSIDLFCNPMHGIYLTTESKNSDQLSLHLVETAKAGFLGIYELLTSKEDKNQQPPLSLNFDFETLTLQTQGHGLSAPLIWSIENNSPLQPQEGSYLLTPGDLIFVPNLGLLELMGSRDQILDWLARSLRHFAREGLESCLSLLEKELLFTTRKNPPKSDLHLLCIQVLPV